MRNLLNTLMGKSAKMHSKDNVFYQLFDSAGNLKAEWQGANLITDAGKAGMASRLNGSGAESAFTYIGIGTGTASAGASDTALGSEITTGGGARASATVSRVTTDVTDDTAQAVVTFNFTAGFAVTETALFNASSAGTMLNRQVFSAVNVTSGDSLQVTIKIDVD